MNKPDYINPIAVIQFHTHKNYIFQKLSFMTPVTFFLNQYQEKFVVIFYSYVVIFWNTMYTCIVVSSFYNILYQNRSF